LYNESNYLQILNCVAKIIKRLKPQSREWFMFILERMEVEHIGFDSGLIRDMEKAVKNINAMASKPELLEFLTRKCYKSSKNGMSAGQWANLSRSKIDKEQKKWNLYFATPQIELASNITVGY